MTLLADKKTKFNVTHSNLRSGQNRKRYVSSYRRALGWGVQAGKL